MAKLQSFSNDCKIPKRPGRGKSETLHSSPLTPYRITRSGRTSTFGGIVRPICLAVFKLTTN